ncbi:DMT family transporter [Marivita sp. S6314]|uniref:DMT family transporter n=1 Tax=Marivita sp. S6314 TaxID=2926406 RepID=UPI001FF50992|nr:DMT family transporter [Marivita sp. S6314]MCK0151896.1 DMT family transporter [Marivita sp. S6314]
MTTLRENRAGLGIALICIGIFAISVNDLLIKSLSDNYPLHQLVFTRTSIALVLSIVILQIEGGARLLKTNRPWMHLTRGLMLVGANMTFFASLAVLPLGVTTALFFVAPLFITLLSVVFLGEKVGPLRIGAIVAGFLGVAVMQEPWNSDGNGIGWLFILPMTAAALYASMVVMTRALGVTSSAAAMTIYNQATFLGVSALFFILAGQGQYDPGADTPSLHFLLRAWVWPDPEDWTVLGIMGIANGVTAYCINAAYKMAPSATVAPFEYIGLPLAIFWGWLVFAEWPTPAVWTGCAMILGAGLFVFLRERQKNKPNPGKRYLSNKR